MRRTRVIPTLLLQDNGLVKTEKFKNAKYVGDPINAIKIFNKKEIDELVFLDIQASRLNKEPDYELIKEFASEAFFPIAYGGGIKNIDQAKKILRIGIEKVVISSSALTNPKLITEIANYAGSSSVVICMDVKRTLFKGHKVVSKNINKSMPDDPAKLIKELVTRGAGEIILHSVDKEGTYTGYDLELITKMSKIVDVPLVALGGARGIDDFKMAVKHGASAVAAGNLFIYFGKHRAVLITYPNEIELEKNLI